MVGLFLKALVKFRNSSRKFFRNIGDRFLIFFQMTYERVKYRSPKTKWIWKKVKLTKEQKKSIDRYYKQNYGKKIPYTYHRLFTGFTGNFDEKYIPEMLYATYFERFLTDLNYSSVFTNKNTLSIFAKGLGVKMPQNIITCSKNIYFDSNFNTIEIAEAEQILKNAGKVFIKLSLDSCGGHGCFISNFVDGVDINTNKSVSETLSKLGSDFSIQEVIVCHDSIRKIYPHSVNTFRIITYILEGKVYYCPIIMRIGLGGSFIDNASAGGIFIAVDDDGTLHKSAFTEYRKEFTKHPDTNINFEGQKIEHLNKIIDTAKRLQIAIPQVGVVNWDFTIDENGEAVLIEANMKNEVQSGSVWLSQMAHGKGAFGDNTAKVLRFIRRAKKLSYTKRKNISM